MYYRVFLLTLQAVAQTSLPAAENQFVGNWISNFSKSKLPSNYQYKRVTLQFAVVFDTVTIGSNLVTASGHEQIGPLLIQRNLVDRSWNLHGRRPRITSDIQHAASSHLAASSPAVSWWD